MQHKKTLIALAVSSALLTMAYPAVNYAQTTPAATESAADKAAREKGAANAAATAAATKKAEDEKRSAANVPVESIVVTATGRNAAANRVPYNVTAIGEEQLREQNITDIKRLIQDSASINAPDNPARFADSVTVRGLNVSPVSANNLEQFSKSTIAYYLDDTPLPNIAFRIKDITRVETLLGPQGTLYGAGSLGGTIRYITNQPRLDRTEYRINSSMYQTKNGELSFDNDIMFNVPLNESFALRGSVSKLSDGGYIDRVSNPPWRTGTRTWVTQPDPTRNVYPKDNWTETVGGRLALLWKLSPSLSITYTRNQQDQDANGTGAVSLTPCNIANATTPAQIDAAIRSPRSACAAGGRFTNVFSTPLAVNDTTIVSRYPEFANRKTAMDAVAIDWNMGFADLRSSTSVFEDKRVGTADYASQGWVYYFDLGDAGGGFDSGRSAYITFDNNYKGLSHETRLTSKGGGPLSWIGGLYYTKQERSLRFSEFLPGMDRYIGLNRARAGGIVDEGYRENLGSEYKETALYGEVSYKMTPAWTTTFGGRVFKYDDTAIAQIRDYSFDLTNNDLRFNSGESGKSIFKFNTAYQVNSDLLTYFTASQGFRRGGTNGFKNFAGKTLANNSRQFDPDNTNNYELGIKGYFFDKQLFVQSNLFRIDWKNVQTYRSQDVENGFPINGSVNAGDARSEGWETAFRWRIARNWQLNYSGALTEAEWSSTKTHCLYSDNTTCRTWSKGGRLGGTPKWKHVYGGRYNTTTDGGMYLWAGVNARYVGKVQVDRADSPTSTVLERPAYTVYNLNGGFSVGDWDVSGWISNPNNNKALVSGQEAGVMGPRLIYTRPRTIGVNVSFMFR
ncbi:MAG: TonB-dependent receptor [Aeromicrobium sp.]|nr:TonB-dependent receptor [Burkholderiales bacterium]